MKPPRFVLCLISFANGYQVYHCDEHYTQHLECAKSEQATLIKLRQHSWLELMTQPLETMIYDALEANHELAELALEDVWGA